MHKFICIGDVHTEYDLMWEALRAASCADANHQPTPPVKAGLYQVVFIGDLVHPKNVAGYERLVGEQPFDRHNQAHLLKAAREQIRALGQLKHYQEQAPQAIHILLGNHDANILDNAHVLGTSGGLKHVEFDPQYGGVFLPADLSEWLRRFPREIRLGSVQFSHVSPLPAHQYYDDLFYNDRSPKRWFRETPEYVQMAGLSFGVYGHTQIDSGILIERDEQGRPLFAMIDALHKREYLEVIYDETQPQPLISVSAVPF